MFAIALFCLYWLAIMLVLAILLLALYALIWLGRAVLRLVESFFT